MREAVNAAGGESGSSASTAAAADARETFAALDAGETAVPHTWVHAGVERAEAGFQDPTLGWVGVRADSSGGTVHAAVVPGSTDAAQVLGGHLEGLNAYLAERHSPVDTVTLAVAKSHPAGVAADQGGGQSMHQDAGRNGGQGMEQGDSGGRQSGSQTSPIESLAAMPTSAGDVGRLNSAEPPAIQGGTYISVMA